AGMVIGVLDNRGSKVFSAGKRDNGTEQDANGDTIFEIGSVTKVFTWLLALDMDRRGEIKLDDPVAKYLPDHVKVPAYKGKEITFSNLDAQDSWNPDDLDRILNRDPRKPSLKEFKEACDAYTAADLFAFLSRHNLTNAPGTKFQYSNVGMALLGEAMASENVEIQSLFRAQAKEGDSKPSHFVWKPQTTRRYVRPMTKATWILSCIALLTGARSWSYSPPTAEISNGLVRVQVYLPDVKAGFYRGTRFDWAGAICTAEFGGHDYFPQWFQRAD